jgi:hypothetical protein
LLLGRTLIDGAFILVIIISWLPNHINLMRRLVSLGLIIYNSWDSLTYPLRRSPIALLIGNSERLQVQNLCLILHKARCYCTAFFSFLRIKWQHASDCLIKKFTVLFFKGTEKSIQSLFLYFIRVFSINCVTVFKSTTWKNRQPNTKYFSQARFYMGRICSLLY